MDKESILVKTFKVINSQKNWRNRICRLISKQYELLKIYTILYLIFGAYFIYDGITKWNDPEGTFG
jgi:hypothetical protein